MNERFFLILFLIVLTVFKVKSQDEDLLKLLDSVSPKESQYTIATFKSTRVIDGHSIERMLKKQLDFRISHRFGMINQGISQFYGLDQSTIYLGLEYGVTDWLMIGIGRTTDEKTVNGYVKFSLFRQCTGNKNFPFSISYYANTSIMTKKWDDPNRDNFFSSRLSFVNQILVARKFNEKISLQISPIWVHKNLVATVLDDNDVFAMGLAGRYKFGRRVSLNAEYYPVIRPVWNYKDPNHTNALSFGFDLETGGHVFQLFLTNSSGMIEKKFITETTGKWLKGDILFGFNISRVFSLKK
jgi:hypothetical protein